MLINLLCCNSSEAEVARKEGWKAFYDNALLQGAVLQEVEEIGKKAEMIKLVRSEESKVMELRMVGRMLPFVFA